MSDFLKRAFFLISIAILTYVGFTAHSFAAGSPAVIFLTSGTTWKVPADWNNANNTIEVIGAGGGGGSAASAGAGGGGGGGAYAAVYNLTLTPNATINIQIGVGGATDAAGTDTYLNGTGTTCAAQSVCAKGGSPGNGLANNTGGAGAASTTSVGTVKSAGGQGTKLGNNGSNSGGGGGGAAGPGGNGGAGGTNSNSSSNNSGTGGGGNGGGAAGTAQNSSDTGTKGGASVNAAAGGLGGPINTVGSAGSNGSGGGGGGDTRSNSLAAGIGGAGGAGNEWTDLSSNTVGSGGGGGGGGGRVSPNTGAGATGGAGGNYGGGGGGGGWSSGTKGGGGAGAPGLIVIKYNTPVYISLSSSAAGPFVPGQAVTFTITRSGAPPVGALSVPVTLGGTAVNGTNYTTTNITSSAVTIPAGAASQTVVVTASSTVTVSKTFTLTLPANAAYTVNAPNSYSTTFIPTPTATITGTLNETTGVATLTWASSGATACTVSGPNGFSASGTSGTQNTTPSSLPATYNLSCTTPVGTKLASAAVAATGPLKTGLMNFWSMDGSEITGATTVKDVSPNMCSPGTLYNAPTATTGHYGTAATALAFNGSNTYIEAPTVGIANTISVSAWVYSSNLNQNAMVVEKEPVNTQWGLLFESGLLKWRGGSATEITTALPSNNAWHHIVATQSGTAAKLYVDGALVKSGTVTAIGNATAYTNTIEIGRYNSGYYFNGSIDDVMVYNRELTASQISQIYALSSGSAAALHTSVVSAGGAGPIVETNASYSPASFGKYGLPVYSDNLSNEWSGNSDNRPENKTQPLQAAGTPADVSSGWYDGTPSPLTCFSTAQSLQGLGSCLYFAPNAGTRTEQLAVTPQVGQSALTTNLVGYWTFDTADISGTSLKDVSGKNNNGVLTNGPVTGGTGHLSQSVSFDGSDDYVSVPHSDTFNVGTGSFSVSAWVNLSGTTKYRVVNDYDGDNGWIFDVNNSSAGNVRVDLEGVGGGTVDYNFSGSLGTGTWKQIAFVVDRSANTLKLYANGVQIGATQDISGVSGSLDPGAPLGMGNIPQNTGNYFKGSMDEVLLYTRALSSSEINQLYTLTATGAAGMHGLSGVTAGIDLVNTNPIGACGVPITHWSYAATGNSTLLVPKYSSVSIAYSCQPSQEYLWSQNRDYSCWPVSCNASTISQRVFRFADRAKVNGTATSGLHGTVTQTVSTVSTFSLQCGGYLPEEGTQTGLHPSWPSGTDGFGAGAIDDFNGDFQQDYDPIPQSVGLPPFYSADRHPACWNFCYWPWTWAYYNVASSTFYQPAATVTVQACNQNEIVVNNVCTACPAGQYRSGNVCTSNPPPTATIDAGAGHDPATGNGTATTTVVGTPMSIYATFIPYSVADSSAPAGKSVKITINHAKVAAAVTNFPVYVSLADMPATFWGYESGSCGDIRVYASDGTTELPREVVTCNSAAHTGELWFRAATLSSAADTSFYIGYGSGAADYAVTATYGAQNVWTNSYGAVWHFPNGSTLTAKDSTSNLRNATNNAATAGPGQVDGTGVYDGSTSYMTFTSPTMASASFTVSGWVYATDLAALRVILDVGSSATTNKLIHMRVDTNGSLQFHFFGNDLDTSAGAFTAGAWHYVSFVYNVAAGSRTIYIDGVQSVTQASGVAAFTGATTGNIGRWYAGGNNWLGSIDQLSIATTPRAATWITTEYNNESSPSSFYSVPDGIAATAINDDSSNTSVDCGKVQGFNGMATTTYVTNGGCENNPDIAKVYNFTPSFTELGTHTYSAQIKTTTYTNYNSYASVNITVTCWSHSHQVSNSCVCDPHYTQQGNSCVLDECTNNAPFPGIQATVPPGCVQSTDGNFTCSPIPGSGYVAGGGECAPPGPPSNITISFSPSRVRSGDSTTVTWAGTNVPAQCTITSNPPIAGLPLTAPSTITGNSTGVSVGPITQNTNITLTCPSTVSGTGTAQKAVGIVPAYQEI